MSCPYFWPAEPQRGGGPRAIMLPLGDLWSGECRATATEPWTPDTHHLHRLCNLGYARGACERFPAESPDAVRFTVVRDDGPVIHLYYVIERDHHPFAHGPLEYSPAASLAASDPFARQVEAYASSYLHRKEA